MFFCFMILEQIMVVTCYDAVVKSMFYLYELGMYFALFHHHYKRLFMYISIKYAISFTYFKFIGGSFHLMHYFVPIYVNPIGVWAIMLLIVILLKQKWSMYLKACDFIYHVEIVGDTPLKVRAYLDTGNSLLWKGTPVIFLDKKYASQIQKDCSCERIVMHSLNAISEIKGFLCDVKIERYKTQRCYISCDKEVALEWGCVCILNMEM